MANNKWSIKDCPACRYFILWNNMPGDGLGKWCGYTIQQGTSKKVALDKLYECPNGGAMTKLATKIKGNRS